MTPTKSVQPSIFPFVIIGIIVGCAIATLIHHQSKSYLTYMWIGLYGLMFLLATQNAQSLLKLSFTTLIPSFFASIPFVWQLNHDYFYFSVTSLSMINAYALHAFHMNYEKNHFRIRYQTLFYAVWDTFVQLFIAFFFMLLCWAILSLCASLFMLLRIDFLKILIQKFWFDMLITSIFLSIGLFVAAKTKNVVCQIRVILLLICQYLFIPLSIIGIVFILTFVLTLTSSHSLFTQNNPADFNQILFLSIAFLCVIFLNGVYQDGTHNHPYPKLLLQLCKLFLWITPIFTLLALYVIYFQGNNSIANNGINLGNFFYFLSVVLLLIYNVTYVVTATQKLGGSRDANLSFEKANIILAMILMTVTLATTNPLFLSLLPTPKNNSAFLNQPTSHASVKTLALVFNNTGFSWKSMNKNALVLGYDQHPIYFCRVKIGNAYQGGIVRNHQCNIVIHNTIIRTANFTILTGPANKTIWNTWKNLMIYNNQALVIFDSATQNPAAICRLIYQNRIVVGTSQNNQCVFIANHKIVKTDDTVQYLYLKN